MSVSVPGIVSGWVQLQGLLHKPQMQRPDSSSRIPGQGWFLLFCLGRDKKGHWGGTGELGILGCLGQPTLFQSPQVSLSRRPRSIRPPGPSGPGFDMPEEPRPRPPPSGFAGLLFLALCSR